jgi:tRNA G18 (ribose-2'-O)-methylase SpoU
MRKLKTYEIERLNVENFKKAEKHPVWLILDNIRSANNVGAVFRTADTFRLAGIALCGITPPPPHREIYKTALGATESVEWEYFESTVAAIQSFQKEETPVIAVEQAEGSTRLDQFQMEEVSSVAYVFGNEVEGMDKAAFAEVDDCVEIPQFGTKHSLNISVSVGIVVWDHLCKTSMLTPNRAGE